MKPKTEEFLNFLLWSMDSFLRPTFRNLDESFEGWVYRNGLMRQVSRLEQIRMVEKDQGASDERLYRLTEAGRLHVLGGRDPDERWGRDWDGKWRIAFFDFPVKENALRERFRRLLREHGFGCLQNSVWISPDPISEEMQLGNGTSKRIQSLFLLEGKPCGGETDAEIVAGAWDFDEINQLYSRHLTVMESRPSLRLVGESALREMCEWAKSERDAWLRAVRKDPLLPAVILPPKYKGREAWRRRVEMFQEAGKQIDTFSRK